MICLKLTFISIIIANVTEQPTESLLSEAEKSVQRYYQSCPKSLEAIDIAQPDEKLLQLLKIISGASDNDEDSYMRYFKKKEWDFQEALQTVQNVLNLDVLFRMSVQVAQVPKMFDSDRPKQFLIKVSELYNQNPYLVLKVHIYPLFQITSKLTHSVLTHIRGIYDNNEATLKSVFDYQISEVLFYIL